MLKFKLLQRTVQLPWLALLLSLLALVLMSVAGIWQLNRGEQKIRMAQAYEQARALGRLQDALREYQPGEIEYRQAKISGRYLAKRQFLLDNRIYTVNGRAQVGYQVLTPFITQGGTVILVDRGWLAGGADRSLLPDVVVDDRQREIEGLISIPSKPFRIGEPDVGQRWPRLINYIDFAKLQQRLQREIYPAILVLDEGQEDAYTYHWKAVIKGPWIHYSYAFQWFAMCIMLLIALLVLGIKTGKRESQQ